MVELEVMVGRAARQTTGRAGRRCCCQHPSDGHSLRAPTFLARQSPEPDLGPRVVSPVRLLLLREPPFAANTTVATERHLAGPRHVGRPTTPAGPSVLGSRLLAPSPAGQRRSDAQSEATRRRRAGASRLACLPTPASSLADLRPVLLCSLAGGAARPSRRRHQRLRVPRRPILPAAAAPDRRPDPSVLSLPRLALPSARSS